MNITVENLGKHFNRQWIFKNLNGHFSSGNTYAITGPNGSGKSTLMQILWGQALPSQGTVTYRTNAGKTVEADDVFKQVSIAAPYMELVDEFTLTELIAFHFKFRQPRAGADLRNLPDYLGLAPARNKRLVQFSSGMKQRVKVGLALYTQAAAYFLDEPTTNFDAETIAWYQQQLQAIAAGATMFIASNQPHEYPDTAHRLDLMHYK